MERKRTLFVFEVWEVELLPAAVKQGVAIVTRKLTLGKEIRMDQFGTMQLSASDFKRGFMAETRSRFDDGAETATHAADNI